MVTRETESHGWYCGVIELPIAGVQNININPAAGTFEACDAHEQSLALSIVQRRDGKESGLA